MVFQLYFTLPEPMQIIIKPSDTPDKIEYDLLEMRSRLIFYTAWNIANRDKRIVVDPKPEKHLLQFLRDDLKKFHGLYASDLMPLKFEVYTKMET